MLNFRKIIKKIIRIIPGGQYICPVCKNRVEKFEPLESWLVDSIQRSGFPYKLDHFETLNYRDYACPHCKESDRSRLYALYLQKHLPTIISPIKVIDFVPTKNFSNFIVHLLNERNDNSVYCTADLYEKNVDYHLDVTNMEILADGQFDFFICSHVLEHVNDDRAALGELYRILKPGGQGIIMCPIMLGIESIDEDISLQDESEKLRRFAQNDHVRLYSKQGFIDRLKNAQFIISELGKEYFKLDTFKKSGIHPQSVLYVVGK